MSTNTAVDASAVARVLGIQTNFVDLRGANTVFLPQRVVILGQGNTTAVYSTDKLQVTSAQQVAQTYGFGSPLHLAAKMLFPVNGDGVGTIPVTVYPLVDNASSVASSGAITPSGAQTEQASYVVKINEISSEAFVIAVGDSIATITSKIAQAINAVLDMPVTASENGAAVSLTSKWKGTSANDIYVEVEGSTTAGTVFAITQPAGGLINPDTSAALAQVGNVWESLFVNCLEFTDTTNLDAYSVFAEGRWGSLVRKPCEFFTGAKELTVAAIQAVTDDRKTQRGNTVINVPGSNNLPLQIAARAVARIASRANNNPPWDYGGLTLTGIVGGTDGEQWDYATRDQAVKAGIGTTELEDGVVKLSDTVTFYRPDGDPTPAYRYVVDIVKLQQCIFNVDLKFNTDEWNGAPLIPDDEPTVNPAAKKPKSAVTAANNVITGLGLNAIISAAEASKGLTTAAIDSMNPKRLNVNITIQLSGNSNIISIALNFGFYFGTQELAA